MKFKSLIALVALVPTLALAQANLPSGVSSTGKPAGMPPAQSAPSSQMGKMGNEEQRKPITPGNTSTSNPSQSSILKDVGSTGNSGSVEMKK